jgi:site-specific DNA-cytosine methylase
MSVAHIALDKIGLPVSEYYAAEIKPIAIKVTKENYPNTIHIGDVNKVSYKDGILYTEDGNYNVGNIDLMVFGSPCQSFSRCMKTDMRVGLEDKTRSGLFLECYRILKEVNPTWYLLENVASMKNEDRAYLTECMGVEPIRINSKLVCAALRDRYYWTNIPGVTQPEDKGITLQSILTSGYTDREKARTLLVSDSRPLRDKQKMLHRYKKFQTIVWEEKGNDDSVRYLNQTELERCQTVPEGYTKCLTRNEAADVLGDAFTVDVIAHIFSFINTRQNDLKEVM